MTAPFEKKFSRPSAKLALPGLMSVQNFDDLTLEFEWINRPVLPVNDLPFWIHNLR